MPHSSRGHGARAAVDAPIGGRPPVPAPAAPDLTPLTGVRWLLGCWIVLAHTNVAGPLRALGLQMGTGALGLGFVVRTLARALDFCYVGTSGFLILGGYCLAWTAHDPVTGALRRSAGSFWGTRAVRFVPLLVLSQVLVLPFVLSGRGEHAAAVPTLGGFLANVVGLQAWAPAWVFTFNAPAWTLSVLFFCWLLYPAVAPRLLRLSPSAATLALLACWVYGLLLAAGYVLATGLMTRAWPDGPPTGMSMLHTHPLVRAPEFFGGVLLAHLHRRGARLTAVAPLPLAAVAVLVLAAGLLADGRLVPYALLHTGLLAPAIWALVIAVVEVRRASAPARGVLATCATRLVGWLATPPLQRLGRAWFSLYLLHWVPLGVVLPAARRLAHPLVGGVPRDAALALADLALSLVYAVAAAVASVWFHERLLAPFTRWLERRLATGALRLPRGVGPTLERGARGRAATGRTWHSALTAGTAAVLVGGLNSCDARRPPEGGSIARVPALPAAQAPLVLPDILVSDAEARLCAVPASAPTVGMALAQAPGVTAPTTAAAIRAGMSHNGAPPGGGGRDTLRIVVLGSSSTVGLGASAPDRAFPAVLERLLRTGAPGTPVSVVAAGVGGDDTWRMVARIDRDVVSRRPTLVVWQTGTNDALTGAAPETVTAGVTAGVTRLRAAGVEVLLLDAHVLPTAAVDTAAVARFDGVQAAIAEAATSAGVATVPRYAWSRAVIADGRPIRDLIGVDGVHMTELGHACTARLIAVGLFNAAIIAPQTR
jgi:peptidoglycan/LPS O-acetylase OafA/YrhL/lysophospholipase L1-like esterase